ncbi:unnamed protein product, partial [Mesorhabditis spiculigera]
MGILSKSVHPSVVAARRLSIAKENVMRPLKIPIVRPPQAKYGGRHRCTLLPGDGIGPEMLTHIKRIFAHSHAPVDFETIELSSKQTDGDMEAALMAVERNGVAIKGNIETKHHDPVFKSRNVELRHRLDLYANIIHCVTIPTIPSRHTGIDIVIVRENTEGEYSGLEHQSVPGVVESIKIVTEDKINRIAKMAFDFARVNNRRKVTAVHKANIQKLGDGLFLKTAKRMAEEKYPDLEFESMIVDNASMQLVP